MAVSLEKYDDLFKRLIRTNSDARAVEQELVLCTSDTYESAKTYGFKPVVVNPEQLEVMSEDTRALVIAYALGKTIYGEDYFCQPLEKLLDPRDKQLETTGNDSAAQTENKPLVDPQMKEALKTMIHMVIGAGYSFGDALEGYNTLGYRLDPLVVRALAEYMLPPPPRPRLFPKNRGPYRFPGIATEQIPVLVGGKEDFRYAMEGIPEDFQGQDTDNQEEYAKMMKVYYLALDQELETEFHAVPLEKDPDFKKLCQVVDKKFEDEGGYMRLYKMQDTQLGPFEKSSRQKFYRGIYLMLDSPERQKQSVDEQAFMVLKNIFSGSMSPKGILVESSSKIYVIPLMGKDFKKQVLTEIVTTFLQASYTLSNFLEKSDKLSVQEKLDIIQIALSQERIKLPNAEEVLLCKIGTSLKEQKKPEDPKNLGGQSGGRGSKGNPGKQ